MRSRASALRALFRLCQAGEGGYLPMIEDVGHEVQEVVQSRTKAPAQRREIAKKSGRDSWESLGQAICSWLQFSFEPSYILYIYIYIQSSGIISPIQKQLQHRKTSMYLKPPGVLILFSWKHVGPWPGPQVLLNWIWNTSSNPLDLAWLGWWNFWVI